jgi:hypothetical protein
MLSKYLIVDGVDVYSPTTVMPMPSSEPSKSMVPPAGDGDTIDDVSMDDP